MSDSDTGEYIVQSREPTALRVDDVLGSRWLPTSYAGRVKVPEENAAAALEVMSRFAVDPRWLIYLPPTMSPAPATKMGEFLEYPESAFDEYAAAGIEEVVCEEKHMGSRAVAVIAKDADVAARRFGISDGSTGAVYTRTGRAFFPQASEELVARVRTAVAPLFEELDTDWLALDCELLPWSAKALGLIKEQFAAVGAAAHAGLPAAERVLAQAVARGIDVGDLATRIGHRAENAAAYRDAYAAYVRPTDGLDGITLAPFQILAAEGQLLAATKSHRWHLEQIAKLTDPVITQTRHRFVDLADPESRAEATGWWLDLTSGGGEGMVVKPVASAVSGVSPGSFPGSSANREAIGWGGTARESKRGKRIQPGLKVRGREYLRIIYGPDYLDSLNQIRNRSLDRKKNLAIREYGLGLESLSKFVAGEPLWKIHQLAFAVLALESEPVDPRL